MPERIHGLPVHVLLVHAVVVLLPVAAAMLVASAVWPAAQRRLGLATPVLALLVLALVPVTAYAGRWLRAHLGFSNPLIVRHARLAGQLWPWAVGIFVLAAAGWLLARRPPPQRWVRPVLGAASVLVAVGGVVQLVRVGDSGAQAVWHGVVR